MMRPCTQEDECRVFAVRIYVLTQITSIVGFRCIQGRADFCIFKWDGGACRGRLGKGAELLIIEALFVDDHRKPRTSSE
jgi:hypothetical protein